MAPPAGALRVGRYFLALLACVAVLYLIVFWPGARHTPKLGLDLEGGTQVIFTAKAPGGQTPSSSAMKQAQQIMEERVNGSGVTEATVVIQGSDQIVISIPGSTNTDVSKLGAAAVLNFRGLVSPAVPVTCTPSASSSQGRSPSATPSSPAAAKSGDTVHDAGHGLLNPQAKRAAAPTPTTKTTPPATPKTTPSGSATPTSTPTSAAAQPCTLKSVAQLKSLVKDLPNPAPAQPGKPWTSTVYSSNGLSATVAQEVSTQLAKFDCSTSQDAPDPLTDYYIACDDSGQAMLLGPVIVPGRQISSASAVAPNASTGQLGWTVALELKSSGQTSWGEYTSAHNIGGNDSSTAGATSQCGSTGTPCSDYVGFTLDGVVLSTPVNISAINGGTTQISGNFTATSAQDLANKLKYGALPLSFKAQQAQTVSATLGTSQLKAGFLAGGIGLALVVVYSLIYYRALGLVTIASLVVSGILVYGCLVMLGTQIGFTLSLAGIAGFIVAVGITADSFVVFFERIKDEVHEGRSMLLAIPRAWTRARRTILSADTVSFLAAAILYYFAAGDVKGFAFTLGLSTILDLIVVFLFTHPLVSLLSRSKAFGSPRFTGLNAVRASGTGTARPAPRPEPRRAATADADGGAVEPSKSAVAVLEQDEPEPTVAEDAAPPAEESAPSDGASRSAAAGEPGAAASSGSAAERAAARRARLREQRQREKGGK